MKVSNKRIAKALRGAMPYLWDGIGSYFNTYRYICSAVDFGLRNGKFGDGLSPADTETLVATKGMIESRLGGRPTVLGWLRDQGIDEWELTDEALQHHRLSWLNMLIAEFESVV
jgi:hypothetical protein